MKLNVSWHEPLRTAHIALFSTVGTIAYLGGNANHGQLIARGVPGLTGFGLCYLSIKLWIRLELYGRARGTFRPDQAFHYVVIQVCVVVGSLFDYKSHLIARADVGIISTLLLIFAYATSRAYLFSFHRLGKHLPGRQGKH